MEWIYRIYHTMQSPLIGIINNKTDKKNENELGRCWGNLL